MRITSKGQITIPKDMRDRFGITRNTEIEFREERNRLVLVKKTDPNLIEKIRGRVKRLPGKRGQTVDGYIVSVRGS